MDILRLEGEQDILNETRRRGGKETMDMEIQKDLKRDIHQAHAGNEEANPSGKKPNKSSMKIMSLNVKGMTNSSKVSKIINWRRLQGFLDVLVLT